MDGVAVIRQSLSTPVLQVLSENKFVVKIDRLFIPRVSLVWLCVAEARTTGRRKRGGVTYRTPQIWVLGGRILHRKEAVGMKWSRRGQAWCLLSSQSLTSSPPHPSVCGADFTAPRRWQGECRHGWLSCSWRPDWWRCHSCGEIAHCHWPAAMWVRSHKPRWWRCTPCRVTLGWEGGREGCWVLWHSCSLWAIHSASENKWEDKEENISLKCEIWKVTSFHSDSVFLLQNWRENNYLPQKHS